MVALISLCQAYIFRDYWEDIGTIKSFYDANLALTEEVVFHSSLFSQLDQELDSIDILGDNLVFSFNGILLTPFGDFPSMQFPKFHFYDPKTPFFTSPKFLPPTKIDKCKVHNCPWDLFVASIKCLVS